MLRPYRSLYVHVPFCHGKCDYCAFYSLPQSTPALHRHYLDRLAHEFAASAGQCTELRSIFLGGGTPSVLTSEEIQHLCRLIHSSFIVTTDTEWTMEANPESLTLDRLAAAVAGGVNRLSLGVQSFQPALRQTIGRRGSLENLESLLREARTLGVNNINIDLIYQLPGQTAKAWRRDLQQAMDIGVHHLSTYALIVEDGTPLAARRPTAGPENDVDFWEITAEIIQPYGLQRYEISNYASLGRICRHNDEIWHGQTYLGCGPAAATFDGMDRRKNPECWEAWLANAAPDVDYLAPERRAAEILAFGFRTLAGWGWSDFRQVTGCDPLALRGHALEQARRLGLIDLDDGGARPTAAGLCYNDDLLEELL